MAGGRKARPAEISPGELGLPVELSNEGVFFACAEIGRQIIVFFCNPLIAVVAQDSLQIESSCPDQLTHWLPSLRF
jgi:hypothetical protein